MNKYLIVLLGGGVGAVLRFLVGTFVLKFFTGVFPLGTLLINVTGSFLIGILMTFFLNHSTIDPNWRLFLVTGVLGGYTTFSTFEWETLFTLREGAAIAAASYLFLSVVLGFAAVWLGAALAGGFRRP